MKYRSYKGEIGLRCYGGQLIWLKTLSISHSRSVQRLTWQQYRIKSTKRETGNYHAHQSLCPLPNETNLLLHSAQGWQYNTRNSSKLLEPNHSEKQTPQKNCLDNTVANNFLGLTKRSLILTQKP